MSEPDHVARLRDAADSCERVGNLHYAIVMREAANEIERLRKDAERREGWKLVPMEPTEAMNLAGIDAAYNDDDSLTLSVVLIYRAMLAAVEGERHE